MASYYPLNSKAGDLRPTLPLVGGDRIQFGVKRLLDVTLAAVALVALAPLLLVVMAMIRLDSPGPVLFVQSRVGSRRKRGGWLVTEFRMYKFRSMRQDAGEQMHRDYIQAYVDGKAESEGGVFKLSQDPRITRIGKWLRRTSMDELPQLINVLKGEMSLVGPRPVPLYEVECYEKRHFQRFCALPGMSGLWQVRGRGRATFEEMIEMDVEYASRQGFKLDLILLLLTIPAILSAEGAR